MRAARTRAVLLVAFLVALTGGPAWAGPNDYYGTASDRCAVDDPEIDELSGLVVRPGGDMFLVEDSTPEPNPGAGSILMYHLAADCAVLNGGPAVFAQDPNDIEDLAGRGETLWFADIGDNGANRETVALITVSLSPSDPQGPQVYRFTYPDGPHDAEALLLPPNGTPYIVTKELDGRSGVYRPGAPLDATSDVMLDKLGEVEFAPTGTPGGPVGRAGQVLVTGGAVSGDGQFLALRTYTDAYVWPLESSDVWAALKAPPVAVVALPDAAQGEAISFAENSRNLVVGSEGVGSVITEIPMVQPLTRSLGAAIEDDFAELSSSDELKWGALIIFVLVVAGRALYRRLFGRKPGSGAHGH